MTPEELRAKYQSIQPDVAALTGLNEIDWSSLEHAHGEASDFPVLLSAALSHDKKDSEFGLILLHETIWHQGTIYQATAYAVPFIAKLIQLSDMPNQLDFALLLAAIAQGKGYFDREFDNDKDRQMWQEVLARTGRDLNEEIKEDRHITEVTRQIVQEYLPLLYPYLKHPEEGIRAYIAEALSHYPNRAQEIIPLLEKILDDETDNFIRRSLVKSLQTLRDRDRLS